MVQYSYIRIISTIGIVNIIISIILTIRINIIIDIIIILAYLIIIEKYYNKISRIIQTTGKKI